MIISHRHGFIFLHSRKTAGSSLTAALARETGEEDLICGPVDDVLMANIIPPSFDAMSADISLGRLMLWLVRRAHDRRGGLAHRLLAPTAGRWRRYYRRHVKEIYGLHDAHTPAIEVRDSVGKETWDRYYKFAFERNPWDRMVSYYHWRMRHFKNGKPSFSEFLRAIESDDPEDVLRVRSDNSSNKYIYTISNEIAVDALCRYENLQEDLEKIYQHIGLPLDGWAPHAKGSMRPAGDRAAEYYDDELDNIIRRQFASEIELLGYEGAGHPGARSLFDLKA